LLYGASVDNESFLESATYFLENLELFLIL